MAIIFEPNGRAKIMCGEDIPEGVTKAQDKWREYCERNWLNDSGDLFTPERKVKTFLDSIAYCMMIGNMKGIETDYKKVMHAKREIPMSSCPSSVDNIVYASGGVSSQVDRDERAMFDVMVDCLDERAKKYEQIKPLRERIESKFAKRRRLGIHDGEWCRVDTEGEFDYDGARYRVDPFAEQYQPTETEYGMLYDMDRILATENGFYDMNYDKVNVKELK